MTAAMSVAVPSGNTLGEGVLWCDREQAVYWTDIQQSKLWRYRPQDGAITRWPMPERLAAMALCEADGWLLLALASRLAFFHPERNEFRDLQDLRGLAPTDTRANDGACDRQGNSITFSPSGDTMYFCDSLQKQILRCDYGKTLGPAQLFVDLQAEPGEPDGSTVDAEGGLWNARWGDARVVRYLPDGTEDRSIATPVSQPTRPAFGGPGHRTLFITSAHEGLDAAARAVDPLAGHLLSIENAGIAGLPEARFAGDPNSLPPRAPRGTSAEIP